MSQATWRSRVRLAALAAAAAISAACATASGVARPTPFPAAPVPTGAFPHAAGAYALPSEDEVIRTAMSLVGVPYRIGGEEPVSGFDCSGLVRFVFLQHAVELPRTVVEQYEIGRPIRLDQTRAGDLVFFSTTAPGPSHVGITLGGGEFAFIHAPGANGAVRVEALTPYWRSRVVAVKRLIQ